MTNFAYTQGIPATNDNPSDDQPDMLVNNDNNFLIWNVDHIGFNQANGGIHNVIHFNNQLLDPPNSAFGQLYTKTFVGNDLFYKAGGTNVVSRLTNLSSNTLPGLAILPGGLMIQWGGGSVILGDNSFTYASPFTTAVFSTVLSGQTNSVTSLSNNVFVVTSTSSSLTGFTARNFSSSINVVSWIAIGY